MGKERKFKIMDTTLRDGSYAVNFTFTADDTAFICSQLESAGVEYIEIGHGVGLGASLKGYGKARATDEEYLAAASFVVKKSKLGMFCIPGIAELDDLRSAADNGLRFVRIGTNATEVEKSKKFIKLAKKLGLIVMSNFMKSYVLNPKEFAEKALMSQDYGSEVVYIVDSAGGMFPQNIIDYINAIRKKTSISIGFHGHDNLGLAVANSIYAVEAGAKFVDVSLQGLGRSAGNAVFEIFLAAMKKKGYKSNIDLLNIFEIGSKYVMPFLSKPGRFPLDVVSGFADFHSSYMPHIHKFSSKYKIKPEKLIIEYSKYDKVDMDDLVLEEIARKISMNKKGSVSLHDFSRYTGQEQDKG